MGDLPDPMELQRSTRDLTAMRDRLRRLVAAQLPDAHDVSIGDLVPTSANGMSSETLLFDVSWKEGAKARARSVVARVAPDPADVPVFETYDLPGQFRTISLVKELTPVPVPEPWFCESDLFVMGRIEGEIPPDVMPYNFGDNWLFDATADQQARLQEASVGILAQLHAIEGPAERFAHLVRGSKSASPLRRHLSRSWGLYEFAARDCGRSALVEKGFVWLEDHLPEHESAPVMCWGDARIGNVIYRDFEPAGVLDWEMASIGPPELDLAWMVYIHQMFEDIAHQYELAGMPAFMRRDDVAATYERLADHEPRDLDWYIGYSCVQMAVVFLRTSWRQVRFGEREAPADPDELPINAPAVAALVASS